ncbi:MAG: sulfatase-like hydrolase/transferase, partial [Pseudomonadota bacterium]|nr:sulfatase-like hydrolase/transferase [Pseudomonadota bacterium]
MRHIFPLFLFSFFTICSAKQAKNLILILADDLGWADTTLYGKTSLYETPNIERLAKRGMKFSNAYSSPICSPTRASILTGQNPARHGMTSPAAHLPEVRLEVIAQTRGVPHQKSCNLKSATRIRKEVP